jgi:hypothetical protein
MVFRMRCDHQSNPLGKNARDRRVGAFIQCEHPPRPHVPFSDRSFRYRVNRVHIFHGALTGIRGLTNQDIPGTLPVCARRQCFRSQRTWDKRRCALNPGLSRPEYLRRGRRITWEQAKDSLILHISCPLNGRQYNVQLNSDRAGLCQSLRAIPLFPFEEMPQGL